MYYIYITALFHTIIKTADITETVLSDSILYVTVAQDPAHKIMLV